MPEQCRFCGQQVTSTALHFMVCPVILEQAPEAQDVDPKAVQVLMDSIAEQIERGKNAGTKPNHRQRVSTRP